MGGSKMKVKELISELEAFDDNEECHGLEVGGGDKVIEVIDIDESGNKVKYPTIIIGERR